MQGERETYLVDRPSGLPTKSGTVNDKRARTVAIVSRVIHMICRDPLEEQKISYLTARLVVLAFGIDTPVVVHIVLPAMLGSAKELTSISISAKIVYGVLDKDASCLKRRNIYPEGMRD